MKLEDLYHAAGAVFYFVLTVIAVVAAGRVL